MSNETQVSREEEQNEVVEVHYRTTVWGQRPDGYVISVEVPPGQHVDDLVEMFNKGGYLPTGSKGKPQHHSIIKVPTGEMYCTRHNRELIKREHQGDVWYSHVVYDQQGNKIKRDGKDVHCRGYDHHLGPGYHLEVHHEQK